jgi:hypothetical protein
MSRMMRVKLRKSTCTEARGEKEKLRDVKN